MSTSVPPLDPDQKEPPDALVGSSPVTPVRPGCSADENGHRCVLITGAAKRLGREIAFGLAADGWDIVIHYHASAAEAAQTVADLQQLGVRAHAVQADLSTQAAVDELFDQALAFAPLRAIVNSASHFDHDTPATFDAERLQAHLNPNLVAPVRLAQRLHASLAVDARGAVVNILDHKLEGLNPDFFSYTLTKQALLGATKMMAMAFAPKLRVVGVSPGLTLPSYLQSDDAFEASHRATALLDSSSTSADIVSAVAFMLASPAITGVNLTVDGGQHMLGLQRDVSYLDPETGV